MPLEFLLLLVYCFLPVFDCLSNCLVNCICCQQEQIHAKETSAYAEFEQALKGLGFRVLGFRVLGFRV